MFFRRLLRRWLYFRLLLVHARLALLPIRQEMLEALQADLRKRLTATYTPREPSLD